MAWNDEQDAHLTQCINEGMTFSEAASSINNRFKTGYSRNAAIGRAARLKLHSKSSPTYANEKRARARRDQVEARRVSLGLPPRKRRKAPQPFGAAPANPAEIGAPQVRPAAMPVGSLAMRTIHAIKKTRKEIDGLEPDAAPLRCAEIEPRHLNVLDLQERDCRYPYGGWPSSDPITFCGHSKLKGLPYCAAHQALVTDPGTVSEQMAARVTNRQAA